MAALLAVGLCYGRTLTYGFDWDDYHQVRAYTGADLWAAVTGPWDTHGIEAPFWRPGSVALFAGRHALVGDDPLRLHALSLVLFGLLVWALIRLLEQQGRSLPEVATGAALLVLHPLTPFVFAGWITQQPHLVAALVCVGTFLALERQAWPWMLLGALTMPLIKEDGFLLAPICVLLARPPKRWLVALGAGWLALIGLRLWALGGVGGYGTLIPGGVVFGALVALLPAAPVLRGSPLLLFLIPFAVAAKPEQAYALVLVCAILGARLGQRPRLAVLVLTICAVLTVHLTPVLGPCSARTRAHDAEVRQWGAAVPSSLQTRLARKTCPE